MFGRRNFLSTLAGLPFLGFLTPGEEEPRPAVLKCEVVGTLRRAPRIRLWKLGSAEQRFVPSDETVNRLATALREWNGKGDLDLIWDSHIEVEEFEVSPGSLDCLVEGDPPRVRILREEPRE